MNKGIEQVLGPRGTPNQDERIGFKSPLAQYDRSAATLPNYKNGGLWYGAAGPSYIPKIAGSQQEGTKLEASNRTRG